MKLYGHPGSTCTRKVLATLAEKGEEVEFVLVDLMGGEQKSLAHLARQPFGVVPVLEDGGFVLYESGAIVRYLDDRLPGARLVPADPRARAEMERWISVEHSYLAKPVSGILFQKVIAPMRGGRPDGAVVDEARAEAARVLDVVDAALAGRAYLAGDGFSLAEIGYLPVVESLFVAGEGELVASRENVAAWWDRVSGRPSWRRVIGKA
ncbi:MAG: hypothetical protein AVDCRST_MAG28-2659 [uncultured Rubrobacteraceae bacterium]|uniref:glutathione transferase n=1 Tax=uncultured Rubrobacteraceae bacterium TaxID=349277 RepID=A0A6J4R5F9_9ACTN|nr:MAG: hypothetical protein AVDCRST_MAG28-2659 [uncultured Rubrobacteraceae bacterium]